MAGSGRHDAWTSADSYDGYMGRWSRPIAARFVDWLDQPPGRDWIELGCGTGALTAAVVAKGAPRSLLAVEPSEGFLASARARVTDGAVEFRQGDAASLAAVPPASRDVAVSGLVLNFVPDRCGALADLRRIVRPGGTVAFYVWDYPGGGIGFMRAFWTAAAALDPGARDLTEDRRFPFCTPDGLTALMVDAGLRSPECVALESPSIFADFDDLWLPFTRGAGPAPGYCASLPEDARSRLRSALSDALPREADGSIRLGTRAWALRATVA